MEITTDSLTWSSEDISVFKTFLLTETGKKFLPKLLENVPALLRGGPVNEILIRSGEVLAWGEAARAILALSVPPPPDPSQTTHAQNYPDPLDDSKWEDGKKTT